MVRTKPEDDYDRKLLHDVKEHGWHLVGIDDEDEGPAYVFSVGIFHTLGHPEICMFGLSSTQTMGQIINGIGDLIKSGQTHDDDGDWQFLCGTTNESEDARLVCLKEVAEAHPSVAELADLPVGWQAQRDAPDQPWERFEME